MEIPTVCYSVRSSIDTAERLIILFSTESPSHDMHVVKLGETQDEDPQVMERVWRLCS
jgi:hypothetical protein